MQDHSLSIHHVAAGSLWLLAASLIVAGLFIRIPSVGQLGLMCTGAAMVINIRGFHCHNAERDRRLFELGRESVELRRVR